MKIRDKTPGNFITVVLTSLICVICTPLSVVYASPSEGVRGILGMVDDLYRDTDGFGWLRQIMEEEFLLGSRETANWLDELLAKHRTGEIEASEVLSELMTRMMRETGGGRSKRLSKLAVRVIFKSAGIHPVFAEPFIRQVDSGIDLSDSATLYRTTDFSDIGLRPAKPYFVLTFDMVYKNMADKSEVQLVTLAETMRTLATVSIEGGYAKFSMIDYEAASFSYMNGLDPSDYNKAIKLHEKIFPLNPDELASTYQAQGFVPEGSTIYESAALAYRKVQVLSTPYFDESSRSFSIPTVQLMERILSDVSRGHVQGFTKNSVLKLWNLVNNTKYQVAVRAFRKAVEDSIGNSLNNHGGSFTESLFEAARESEELHKLFEEILAAKNRISTSLIHSSGS